jgi:hypothetical protein
MNDREFKILKRQVKQNTVVIQILVAAIILYCVIHFGGVLVEQSGLVDFCVKSFNEDKEVKTAVLAVAGTVISALILISIAKFWRKIGDWFSALFGNDDDDSDDEPRGGSAVEVANSN